MMRSPPDGPALAGGGVSRGMEESHSQSAMTDSARGASRPLRGSSLPRFFRHGGLVPAPRRLDRGRLTPGGCAGDSLSGGDRGRSMRSIAIALGLAAMGWSAAAQPGPSIITMPDWSAKPTGEDLAGVYPEAAMKAGLEGRATIACVTTADGLLADCQVVAEDPPGAGFGDAALTLSARFRMRPMTKDGHAVAGGKVRIPIVFRLPAPAPAPAALLDHPDWVHRPKGEEVTRVYPLEAERRHVSGGAVLSCSVTAEGRLTACQA